jgi:hypothetical protein
MPLTVDTVIVRVDDVTSAEVDGELLMMRLESDAYFGLDDIGARVWALLAQPTRIGAVVAALVREYDVTPEQCQRDVLRFVGDLAEKGLVHEPGAGAA